MKEKIMVTVGPSKISSEVIQYADRLACKREAKLIVLHVIERSPYYPSSCSEFKEFMAGVELHSNFITLCPLGYPPDEIVKQIKKWKPSQVIMAGHSHHFLERIFLGSTVKYVVHHSEVPVMIYKRACYPKTNSVVVPVDFTDVNKKVIALADEWGANNHWELHFIHVPLPMEMYSNWAVDTYNSISMPSNFGKDFLLSEEEKKLEDFIKALKIKSKHHLYVREGVVYDAILNLQKEVKANLIMLASHSHNVLGRMLLGGNSDYILNHTKGSVFLYQEESEVPEEFHNKRGPHETINLEL